MLRLGFCKKPCIAGADEQITTAELEKAFGDAAFAQRCVAVIKGISDLLLGQYFSKSQSSNIVA